MKNVLFLFVFLTMAQFGFAQTLLSCQNGDNKNDKPKVSFISQSGQEITLSVHWPDRSTFAKKNLEIQNGTCENCPNVGGSNPKTRDWTIRQSDSKKAVTIAWATSSTIAYCGGSEAVTVSQNSMQCDVGGDEAMVNLISQNKNQAIVEIDLTNLPEKTQFNAPGDRWAAFTLTGGSCQDCAPARGLKKTIWTIRKDAGTASTLTWTDKAGGDCKGKSISLDGKVIDYDGNTYETVRIGNQVWLASNLKTTHCSDGTDLQVLNLGQSSSSSAMYWHNNNSNSANSRKYGPLYNYAAVENCNVCPTNFHVPSQDEWNEVLRFWYGKNGVEAGAKGLTYAAYQLRETGSAWPNNSKATNSTGFSALPGGWLWKGSFRYLGSRVAFWAPQGSSQAPGFAKIASGNDGTWTGSASSKDVLYIRCVRD